MKTSVAARAAALVFAGVLLSGLGLSAATSPQATRYSIELAGRITQKSFKFYVTTEPVKCAASMNISISPEGRVSLTSAHYSWVTTGLSLDKTITPEKVEYIDNGSMSVQWTPGQTKKGEVNPLEVFGKPFGAITPGGRGPGVITRNPEKFVRFFSNFRFGSAFLLHRPALPAGELKPGQTFEIQTEMPDPTYSAVKWAIPVQWTVDRIAGKGAETVLELSGAGAATQDETSSWSGRLTDGTISSASKVKMKLESGELISGETTVQARWKKDPAGSTAGIMDTEGTAAISEKPVEK